MVCTQTPTTYGLQLVAFRPLFIQYNIIIVNLHERVAEIVRTSSTYRLVIWRECNARSRRVLIKNMHLKILLNRLPNLIGSGIVIAVLGRVSKSG